MEHYKTTMAIRIANYGAEHPKVASPLYDIGLTYFRMKDFPKALEYFNKALAIQEKAYGSDDERTMKTIEKIAAVQALMKLSGKE